MNIVFKGSPIPKKSFFIMNFDQVEVQVDDFGLEFQGGDLAVIADFFDDFIRTFAEEYLLGSINN